ncbi:MAG: hypothetical protein PQJ60_14300 [Spirochaetales bacterium]|nr:hypothetical protein [Spirochaetales bacterium]
MLIAGVIINLVVSLITTFSYGVLGFIMLAVAIFQCVGLGMISGKQSLSWANYIKWSSILFIPIGMISMLGANKILEEAREKEFFAEREEASAEEDKAASDQ